MSSKTGKIYNFERIARRRLLTLLSSALIFFILGVGNLLFGLVKGNEYRSLIQQAQDELKLSEQPVIPLVDSSLNIYSHVQHVNRLKSRLDYYDFVTLGGKVFLALSGIFLLLCLVIKQTNEEVINQT